jgi:glycosyltransferase involved in cell wall biosynthesis
MHVLLVSSLYNPYILGGAEIVVEQLAKGLVKKGHRVTVVSTCGHAERESESLQDGVNVVRFFPSNLWWLYESSEARRSLPKRVVWRVRDAWNEAAGKCFGRILDRAAPDLVHTHYIKGLSPSVWREARMRSLPIVHTAHGYELICVFGSLWRGGETSCLSRCLPCLLHGQWYCRQARMVDAFCSPSRFLLQQHKAAGVRASCFELVRNGTTKPSVIVQRTASSSPMRFLYLGQLVSHKGIKVLLDSVAKLQGISFVLDIAGKGPLESSVREAAMSDSRIRFHGFVQGPQKQRLLAACDVLLFPSVWVENAPVAIAEAFANGLPVVASDLGASPEFVQHDLNGLLFPPGDESALAACLLKLVASPDLVKTLRNGVTQTAKALPSIAMMTEDYLKLYRTILDRPEHRDRRRRSS